MWKTAHLQVKVWVSAGMRAKLPIPLMQGYTYTRRTNMEHYVRRRSTALIRYSQVEFYRCRGRVLTTKNETITRSFTQARLHTGPKGIHPCEALTENTIEISWGCLCVTGSVKDMTAIVHTHTPCLGMPQKADATRLWNACQDRRWHRWFIAASRKPAGSSSFFFCATSIRSRHHHWHAMICSGGLFVSKCLFVQGQIPQGISITALDSC